MNKHILIIAPPLIGDSVMIIPHLEAFKKYPDVSLFFLGSRQLNGLLEKYADVTLRCFPVSPEFFQNNQTSPDVMDSLVREFSTIEFDMIFDHLGNANSKYLIERLEAPLSVGVCHAPLSPYTKRLTHKHVNGWVTDSRDASQCFSDLYKVAGIALELRRPSLKSLTGRATSANGVLINPGAGSVIKRWSLESFVAVGDALATRGLMPTFLVGPAEMELKEKLSEMTQHALFDGSSLSLVELCQYLLGFKVLVTNDCAIMHLGAAQGLRTVALFAGGFHNPTKWFPYSRASNHVFVGDHSASCDALPSEHWQSKIQVDAVVSSVLTLANGDARGS